MFYSRSILMRKLRLDNIIVFFYRETVNGFVYKMNSELYYDINSREGKLQHIIFFYPIEAIYVRKLLLMIITGMTT